MSVCNSSPHDNCYCAEIAEILRSNEHMYGRIELVLIVRDGRVVHSFLNEQHVHRSQECGNGSGLVVCTSESGTVRVHRRRVLTQKSSERSV
jgi:hypothetical protein